MVNDLGQVLLIQRRDNDHWEPPGGVLEIDEAIEDGLRREIREETGLDVQPVALTGVYKNMARGVVALVFSCVVTGGKLATSSESKQVRWIDPDDVSPLVDEAFAVRLFDSLRPEGPPAIREHDGIRLL
jgi:ADP-ribose pyrophosphatase YjhB (NUDIX family)